MAWGNWILVALASVAVVPAVVLAVESLMALWPRTASARQSTTQRLRCAVLIPAHNEVAGIGETIAHLQAQLIDGDRLIVIADNCSDETARVARQAGAEALERHDPERRGKGFAIEFGLQHLESCPPEIVVLVDADTRALPGSLDALVRDAGRLQSPIQGVFTDSPKPGGVRQQWSAFALTFKNYVRPLGLSRLGMPCQLTGSGMAFPWAIIQKAELGSGNIVEDMQLGIDLALAGYPPRFCPDARFESDDAPNLNATTKRRTRWEHGHVFTLLTQAPRLLFAGLTRLRPRLIALGLDLAVPPLTLLGIGIVFLMALSGVWWLLDGSSLPLLILMGGAALAALAVGSAWLVHGRRLLSLRSLCLLPVYMLWKVPIYLKLVAAPERSWVRTERSPSV